MIVKNRVVNPNSARIEFNRQNCKITSLYLPFLLRHLSDGNYKKLLSICKDLLYRMAITFQKLFYISKGLMFNRYPMQKIYNNFRIKTSTQSTATNAIHGLNNHGGHRGLSTGIFFWLLSISHDNSFLPRNKITQIPFPHSWHTFGTPVAHQCNCVTFCDKAKRQTVTICDPS